MTHTIEKYGDIGNFSGVTSVVYIAIHESQICGDIGPYSQNN